MTSDQKYEGRGNSATQPNQNGSIIEQTAKSATSAVTAPHPLLESPKGDIIFPHRVSVNARYGTSAAHVLLFALDEYRSSRIEECLKGIKSREFEEAYNHFQDAQRACESILELGLGLSSLSDKNYWASQGELPKTESSQQGGFDQWWKEFVGEEPASSDSEINSINPL